MVSYNASPPSAGEWFTAMPEGRKRENGRESIAEVEAAEGRADAWAEGSRRRRSKAEYRGL